MHWYLFPFSLLYNIVTTLRNRFFDWGWFESRQFKIPIISVGNITVGGTGKTPHIEYLIRKLTDNYSIGIISRGYKRKTKGYLEVNTLSKAIDVGDEPLQIKQKFQSARVVVDEKRVHAVEKLLADSNTPEIILLDDAFQHRHIEPGLNILLVDYNKPITKDYLLPVGRLRESAQNKKRADIVILTKCPANLNPIDFRIMSMELNLFPYQNLYFTTFTYNRMYSVFSNHNKYKYLSDLNGVTTLVATGIANPKPIYKTIENAGGKVKKLNFPDHHDFSSADVNKIINSFMSIKDKDKLIICTEKDAVRLKTGNHAQELSKVAIYALPIEVSFLNDDEQKFIAEIENYIKCNKASIN